MRLYDHNTSGKQSHAQRYLRRLPPKRRSKVDNEALKNDRTTEAPKEPTMIVVFRVAKRDTSPAFRTPVAQMLKLTRAYAYNVPHQYSNEKDASEYNKLLFFEIDHQKQSTGYGHGESSTKEKNEKEQSTPANGTDRRGNAMLLDAFAKLTEAVFIYMELGRKN